MTNIVSMEFSIAAAKSYDYDDETGESHPDWKYIDQAATIEEAMAKFSTTRGYPIRELTLNIVYDDDTMTRVDITDPNGSCEYFKKEHFQDQGGIEFFWKKEDRQF